MPNWKKIALSGSSPQFASISIDTTLTAGSLTGSLAYTNLTNLPSLISSSAQIASDISGSFVAASSSIAADILLLELFSSSLDTTSLTLSGSFTGDGSGLFGVVADVAEIASVADSFTNVTTRAVTHNFNTKNVIVTVYNSSDQQIIPDTITTTDANTVTVTFDTPSTGRIVIAKGGHIISGSASDSLALNGQSGSYYLDYNNFTNIPSGIVSSSIQITNLTRYEQSISGNSSYTVNHNLDEDFPIVQIYDTNKKQVIPGEVTSSNANTVLLNFDSSFTGTVIVKK